MYLNKIQSEFYQSENQGISVSKEIKLDVLDYNASHLLR